MSSDIHSVLVGEVWRKASVVAKASGSAIAAGTVNYYLKALTGADAGKWWKNADQTWDVAETANAMTHQADGCWTITLAATPFADAILYLEYAKESGDLHVAGEGRLLRGKAVVTDANVTQYLGTACPAANVAGVPPVDLTHIDGEETQGNNATLYLKKLDIVNVDAPAVSITSNASFAMEIYNNVGSALLVKGQAYGVAIEAEAGTGAYIYSSGGNGNGLQLVGSGTGYDLNADIHGTIDAVTTLTTYTGNTPQTANHTASVAAILADTGELQTNQGAWATATGFATSAKQNTMETTLNDNRIILADWEVDERLDVLLASANAAALDVAAWWVNGGRLDLLLDQVLEDTGELQTNQGAWATATGFSTHHQSDVWGVAARTLSAATNLNIPTSDQNAAATWAEAARTLTASTNLNIPTSDHVAQAVLGTSVSDVEDTAAQHSLTTLVLGTLESSISGTTWTIKKTGGTTFTTKTVTSDADAVPIVGVT